MKITKENLDKLGMKISAILSEYSDVVIQNTIREYQANPKIKDYRIAFMWRVFSIINKRDSFKFYYELLEGNGLNDSHIETAMKHLFKKRGLLYP